MLYTHKLAHIHANNFPFIVLEQAYGNGQKLQHNIIKQSEFAR